MPMVPARSGGCVGRCVRQLGSHCPGSSRRVVLRRPDTTLIRVVLPTHLRMPAHVGAEVQLGFDGRATQRSVLDWDVPAAGPIF